ncbi:ParA family partition ATPase [Acaryochloris marina]|uniref:Conserved CobQ/CobB/MinD/ParA domain n=1 Tax=Acaryochloris marina (strain MBIC 11017) TaxID=329726 RepID=A8ZPC4_ACAM1|nr:ParA family partition ATPase [Acaryochloris marina]ABW32860.1 Conserved CobQ/CobB/MinD/ParA domain [Acaryochloris marina MBIC11017]BDM83752.1 cobyrinic acid a,c-diamide synthase [Acaryochloris marina MBIC10699]
MIITLASLKGGSGKTSLAVHLSHAISLEKKKVLLVDADPQASAQNWAAARETKPPFTVVGMARNTLHRDLPDLLDNFDHAVIDTPPRVSALARTSILAADLVIIPVQPSSYDVWAAAETVALLDEAKGFKPELKAVFVVNRVLTRTLISKDVVEALAEYDVPTLSNKITQRVAFAEASSGYTVLESEPKKSAAKEIKALSKEILKFLELKRW